MSRKETGADAFYVGYRRRAPAALARFVRGVSIALVVLAAGLAAFLAAGQKRFGPGTFEFGIERELSGVIAEHPHPMLVVPRPGAPAGDGAAADPVEASRYPLVARGKHGAAAAVAGLDGEPVRATGTLIYRPGTTLLELAPGSPARPPGAAGRPPAATPAGGEDLGVHTLRGEIVDSKCWLGVMKPNRRKPHRACATLCIRGGIPPALLVETASGGESVFLLAGGGGEPVGPRLLDLVAEPVEVTGRIVRHGDLLVLAADPAAYRRLNREKGPR